MILTSATLAVGGNFDFLKRRLGIENAKERVLDSHFDYPRQALLYTPLHLPDPRQPNFARLAAEEVVQLLKATRGRAFVLFTSHQQMREVFERVRPRVRYPMLIQGSMPRTEMLDALPLHAPRRAFWDKFLLAGCGRAGRAIERRGD